jgi:hypothetical protein
MMQLLFASSESFSVRILGKHQGLPPHIAPELTHIITKNFDQMTASGFTKETETSYVGRPLFFEENQYRIFASKCTLTCRPPQDFSEELEHHDLRVYTLRIGSQAGQIGLEVRSDVGAASITFEIFPSKVDYKSDYESLVDDLESLARGLSFSIMGQTAAGGASIGPSTSAADWAARSENLSREIYREIAHLARHGPKSSVATVSAIVSARRARSLPPGRLRDLSLGRRQQGQDNIAIYRRVETFDTPVNRFVRHELTTTVSKLRDLCAAIKNRIEAYRGSKPLPLRRVLASLESARSTLNACLLFEFVAVAGNLRVSDRFSFSRSGLRYSGLLKNLSFFRRIASIHVNQRDVSSERIWQLYEWWVFYKLASSIAKYLKLASASFINYALVSGEITLSGGNANAVDFLHPKTGDIVRLIYRTRAVESATVRQEPDALFEMSTIGGWYVFDAKYKLQYDPEYLSRYRIPGPQELDINTAHRYRDAVLHKFCRVVEGSYIIFPFRPARRFKFHRFFTSIRTVDVGAIPLLPGNDELLDYVIRRLLRKSLKGKSLA